MYAVNGSAWKDAMPLSLMRILLIEDDEEDYFLVRQFLSRSREVSYELIWASTYEEGVKLAEQNHYSAILVDYNLGQYTGLDFIHQAVAQGSDVPIILLAGHGNYNVDLQAMKAGAADYLTKAEVTPSLLERSIRYAIEHKQAEIKLRQNAARAEILAGISQKFLEVGPDYYNLLNATTRRLAETLGDSSIIRILKEDGKTLEAVAMDHPDPVARQWLAELLARTTVLVGEGLEGEAAQSRTPKLLSNLPVKDYIVQTQKEYASWIDQYPVDSLLVVPLSTPDRLIGTLSVFRLHPKGAIPEADQSFYIDLANRAAVSIENARLHAEVQRLAVTDMLTGLLNRRGFAQLGDMEIERFHRYGRSLSIIMIDIDHFKSINDTYGHAFGDEVLKTLATTCTMHTRRMDLASRYGGDEFIVLLPETDLETANTVAIRICDCFRQKVFTVGEQSIHLSISLGVVGAQKNIKNLEELINKVDQALYVAKQKGRNRVEVG